MTALILWTQRANFVSPERQSMSPPGLTHMEALPDPFGTHITRC